MSNVKLAWLADELSAAGLEVDSSVPGWESRTNSTANVYDPIGVVDHHTVGVGYVYPYTFLWDKCNILVRPSGLVVPVNAGYAYDSGLGSPLVLDHVRNDETFSWEEIRNETSVVNGNKHFIDIEVEHPGDGSPIPAAQYEALVRTNAVICARYGWDPMTRVIGHYEWAPDRKIDPYWNGSKYVTMPEIRKDTAERMTPMFPISYGHRSDAVRGLQHELNFALGAARDSGEPNVPDDLEVDGDFGPATLSVLRFEFPARFGGPAPTFRYDDMKILERRNQNRLMTTRMNKRFGLWRLGAFDSLEASVDAAITLSLDHEANHAAHGVSKAKFNELVDAFNSLVSGVDQAADQSNVVNPI